MYRGDLNEDLKVVARNKLAEQLAPVSITSKMPCAAWGISASRCRIGTLLNQKEGSVCQDKVCYAKKGRFLFPNVQAKLEQAYQGLFHELWTPALVHQVRWFADAYFRLFHAGDLQGANHLKNLVSVARAVPDVKMWLPTKESGVVKSVLKEIGSFPENLVVRVSATMIDGSPPNGHALTSTVVSDPAEATCPAPQQKNACGDCRDCWSPDVLNVAYKWH